jgi:hypothetical protein
MGPPAAVARSSHIELADAIRFAQGTVGDDEASR